MKNEKCDMSFIQGWNLIQHKNIEKWIILKGISIFQAKTYTTTRIEVIKLWKCKFLAIYFDTKKVQESSINHCVTDKLQWNIILFKYYTERKKINFGKN